MNLNFNKQLTNFDLMDLASFMGIKLNEVLMKDEATHRLPKGYYIFNLENSNQSGSHWVGMLKKEKMYYYFDPYGIPPPQTLIDLLRCAPEHLLYNDTQIQYIDSILCGYFCLVFLYQMQQSSDMVNNIANFLQLFYLDTRKNDKELKNIISNIFIKRNK